MSTPGELIFHSDIVARVRLLSVDAATRLRCGERPAPFFLFRFRVMEYLKGSGDGELTVRLLAEYCPSDDMVVVSRTPDADMALQTAKARLAQRDAR